MMNSSKCVRTIKTLVLGAILAPSVASAGFYDERTDTQEAQVRKEKTQTPDAEYLRAHFEVLRSERMEAIMSTATPAQREMLLRRENDRKKMIQTMPN